MLQIGVTGSRKGPVTLAQENTFFITLTDLIGAEFATLHHGDCIGWDEHCHNIALSLGLNIVIHPPEKSEFRAFCKNATEWRSPKPYIYRNRNICISTSVLIGLPSTMDEKKRGGTWSTIRYARALQRKVITIYPDGSIR